MLNTHMLLHLCQPSTHSFFFCLHLPLGNYCEMRHTVDNFVEKQKVVYLHIYITIVCVIYFTLPVVYAITPRIH